MNIPLLADKSATIAKAYGVLNEETGIPFRGLFIIDTKGILRQVTINDLPVGRSVDETLRLVQAFQYTDKNGEGKYSLSGNYIYGYIDVELVLKVLLSVFLTCCLKGISINSIKFLKGNKIFLSINLIKFLKGNKIVFIFE